jgi:hypothetical protein
MCVSSVLQAVKFKDRPSPFSSISLKIYLLE